MSYLKSAWNGWGEFITAGKLAGVFLAALLFLLFQRKKVKQQTFLLYTTIAAVLCIFPVTAAILMLYQTRFFDYQWIWTMVPMTGFCAFAAVLFLEDHLKEYTSDKRVKAAVVLMLLGILAISSGLGKKAVDPKALTTGEVKTILASVKENCADETVKLWAPEEVLAKTRALDGSIELLYGRNMWDNHLNAYAYDVYSEDLQEAHFWIEHTTWYERIPDDECLETVVNRGVNCILLPMEVREDSLEIFLTEYEKKAVLFEKYYLLTRIR